MSLSSQVSSLATRVGTEVKSLWAAVNAKAPLASPSFTGTVSLPSTTSIGNVSSTEIGYVDGVTSAIQTQLNGKAASSHTHAQSDVTDLTTDLAAKAPLASPALTGTPTAPTAAAGTNTTQLATTAFVNAEITNDRPFEATASNIKMDGTAAVGSLGTVARGDHVHPTDTSRAPLASPTFTGTPAAPTAAVDTNTTQVATTAFVIAQAYLKSATAASTYAPLAGPTFTGTVTLPSTTSVGNVSSTELGYLDGVTSAIQTQLNGKAASSHTHAQSDITSLTTDLAAKAPLASPTFTGTPAAPTATAGTDTTQIATTAFVQTALSSASASPQDSNLVIGLAVFS